VTSNVEFMGNSLGATAATTEMPAEVNSTSPISEEKSSGGLSYNLVIADASVESPVKVKKQKSPLRQISQEDIESKLTAAQERRKSMEVARKQSIKEHLEKIQNAQSKRDEQTDKFITSTKSLIDQKLNTADNNREKYYTDLKTKIKDHMDNVEKVKVSTEAETETLRTRIDEKLSIAAEKREENIDKMVKSLKEHEEKVKSVQTTQMEQLTNMATKIQDKLSVAEAKREEEKQKKIEALREHEKHAEIVRQNKEKMAEGGGDTVSPCTKTPEVAA